MDVFDALARLRAAGLPAVLVTVLEAAAGAPARPGAKLVVAQDGIAAGTLGCSEFDSAAVELAAEALSGRSPLRRQFSLEGHGEERAVEVFAEVHAPEPALIVLGANPVARAIAALARMLDRRVVLVAPGGDAAAARGVEVKADDPARYLLAAAPGEKDAVVVSDHDASWADEALRTALASDAFFVGMLGSRRHAPAALGRLRTAGVPESHLDRLRCPCGLDIGGRSPEEIALSVVAEIVATQHGRDGGRLTRAPGAG